MNKKKSWVREQEREKFLSARVSTKDQNLARQLVIAEEHGIPEKNIFADKITGRKKEREHYDDMKAVLQPGDEVYFTEIDRIGRSKALIKEELEWFKSKGVIVRVLNVPTTLIEFPAGQEWVMEMVNNILIEVLSAVAENEWQKTKERREAGIDAMPVDEEGYRVSSKTGRRFGRAAKNVDLTLLPGETVRAACERLGISRNTYYNKLREAGGVCGVGS